MKTLFVLTILISSICWRAGAQPKTPTRIYIYNASGSSNTLMIRPVNRQTKPTEIKIRPRHWGIFRITSDSLGLSSNGLSYFIHFDSGKKHYFIAETGPTATFVLSEKSEREFLLTVVSNNANEPEEYDLDN